MAQFWNHGLAHVGLSSPSLIIWLEEDGRQRCFCELDTLRIGHIANWYGKFATGQACSTKAALHALLTRCGYLLLMTSMGVLSGFDEGPTPG